MSFRHRVRRVGSRENSLHPVAPSDGGGRSQSELCTQLHAQMTPDHRHQARLTTLARNRLTELMASGLVLLCTHLPGFLVGRFDQKLCDTRLAAVWRQKIQIFVNFFTVCSASPSRR